MGPVQTIRSTSKTLLCIGKASCSGISGGGGPKTVNERSFGWSGKERQHKNSTFKVERPHFGRGMPDLLQWRVPEQLIRPTRGATSWNTWHGKCFSPPKQTCVAKTGPTWTKMATESQMDSWSAWHWNHVHVSICACFNEACRRIGGKHRTAIDLVHRFHKLRMMGEWLPSISSMLATVALSIAPPKSCWSQNQGSQNEKCRLFPSYMGRLTLFLQGMMTILANSHQAGSELALTKPNTDAIEALWCMKSVPHIQRYCLHGWGFHHLAEQTLNMCN